MTIAPPALPRAPTLLTITAHPIPPGVVLIAVRGEVDMFTRPPLPLTVSALDGVFDIFPDRAHALLRLGG